MNEQLLKALVRIKQTHDGQMLLEWLDALEGENYVNFLMAHGSNDLHEFKGVGICLNKIKAAFKNAESKLLKQIDPNTQISPEL